MTHNSTSFKNGHSPSEKVRKKMSDSWDYDKHFTKETRRKIGSKSKMEKNCNWANITKKELIKLYLKDKKSIQEISKILKRDAGTITRKLKLYNIRIRTDSESLKLKWKNKEFAEKTIRAILKGLITRPTSYEQKISELCIKNNLPFIYTGNGTFLIGYKNPDFINRTEKIAIEVYHNYFKIRDFGSCENYEKQRSEYFAERGWNTIFIRTEEITHKDWENVCLSKINEFPLSSSSREPL